eukprot:jgi/Tetstr1/427689/TSEL_017814.t1
MREAQDKELRDSYKLKQFIVVTHVSPDMEAPATSEASGSTRQQVEDKSVPKHATWSFTFPVEMAHVGKGELASWHLVMAVQGALSAPRGR